MLKCPGNILASSVVRLITTISGDEAHSHFQLTHPQIAEFCKDVHHEEFDKIGIVNIISIDKLTPRPFVCCINLTI